MKKRPYVVTSTAVMAEGRGSNALTRDAIRLEVAMRLVIEGINVQKAWNKADAFVKEMDSHLPELPEIPNESKLKVVS